MQENLNNKKNEIIDFSNLKPQNNNDNYYNKSSIKNYIPFIIIGFLIIGAAGFFYGKSQIKKSENSQDSVTSVSTGNYSAENSSNIQTNSNERPKSVDNRHEIINGYTYLKSNGNPSTYSFKVTHWAELILDPYTSLTSNPNVQASYEDYCRIVREIEKVDSGIVPGTDRVFENATYQEVDDAYKEHLREISQIRQIYDLINGNDNQFEPATGCFYKGTKWNTNNMKYKAKEFKSEAIDELWSKFSY